MTHSIEMWKENFSRWEISAEQNGWIWRSMNGIIGELSE
jgi:hypothetical protein